MQLAVNLAGLGAMIVVGAVTAWYAGAKRMPPAVSALPRAPAMNTEAVR
jgi:hypothetical protein